MPKRIVFICIRCLKARPCICKFGACICEEGRFNLHDLYTKCSHKNEDVFLFNNGTLVIYEKPEELERYGDDGVRAILEDLVIELRDDDAIILVGMYDYGPSGDPANKKLVPIEDDTRIY